MLSKVWSRSTISLMGCVVILFLCIGLPGAIAQDAECNLYGCDDDCEFTQEFFLNDCKFKTRGINPYFILKPGYRLVLESEDEKSVETVLCDTKWIKLDGRWIKTRVVEERAIELDEGSGKWKTVEISLNWFAICKKTNAVYYFGEDSRDCPAGFDENDVCTGTGGCDGDGECTEGSWEAGKDDAQPGLIMPGTALMGAKYFQEIAEAQEAVDRGQIVDVGLEEPDEWSGLERDDWSDCIEIHDTNPTEADEGGCVGENDVKLYCRGVGLVADQELQLVERGFVGCDGDDGDDDDDHDKRWWWGRR